LSGAVMFDRDWRHRTTGSFILIDEAIKENVGAGMLFHA
jgi:sulfate adenylyltransferase subunit 1 (EFTu-like GTPase family)